VSRTIASRFRDCALGDELVTGKARWTVVGIFDADGSSFESEVWVDVRELANDAKRPFPYSGVRIRVARPEQLEPLIRRIDDDPRFALEAERETEYYAKQSESANTLYVLVVGIAVLAGIGAGFGAANTMYAAVQARTAEIGTLRALGFSRGAILTSFQVEALAVAAIGFVLGALCSLVLLRSLFGVAEAKLALRETFWGIGRGLVFLPDRVTVAFLLLGIMLGCLGSVVSLLQLRVARG